MRDPVSFLTDMRYDFLDVRSQAEAVASEPMAVDGVASRRSRILIVEDEPSIRDLILYPLETEGCDTEWCGTGAEALQRIDAARYDLIILDVGLPDIDGFEICRAIRKRDETPIVFLTARSDEIDRVVGLELGGDDYVTKPFSPRELAARVRAILRRCQRPRGEPAAGRSAPESESERFRHDEVRCTIHYLGIPLELSRCEYRLLLTFLAAPGRVFTRAQLMDAAWDDPESSMERTVDAHIKAIRSKLRLVGDGADPIRTHRGLGYSLVEEE